MLVSSMVKLEITVYVFQRLMEAALIGPIFMMYIQEGVPPFTYNGGFILYPN